MNIFKICAGLLLLTGFCYGACPLDHLRIGCNPDGIIGTEDDNRLFVECTQKYRHSDPANAGGDTWLNWYYPMYYSPRYDRYSIGEPGFDLLQGDPNRVLAGQPGTNYEIIIECVSISSDLTAKNSAYSIEIKQPGDFFNHSALSDSHIHMTYQVPAPQGAEELQWLTFIMYDALGNYEQSEPFSIAFVNEPIAGDLVIDGVVDINDLAELCYYWLNDSGGIENDYYERADIDKNGKVDLYDFAALASNWDS